MEVAVSGFQHQVGGHFGLLQCEGHVAKPLDARELAFYKQLSPRFKKFAPAYCGTVIVRAAVGKKGRLRLWSEKRGAPCHPSLAPLRDKPSRMRLSNNNSASAHDEYERDEEEPQVSAVMFRVNEDGRVDVEQRKKNAHHWAANCQIKVVQKLLVVGPTTFILLENIVHGMQRPCVLDLKMGTRQHGDDASEAKQRAQRLKCAESTSAALGVRMVGMELYEEATASYSFIDKMQGRKMDESHFSACLRRFVKGAGRERAATLKLRLNELRATLTEAEGYRFFSSSLLVAYDAANPDSSIQVRMIDFAHSTFTEMTGFADTRYEGPDEGYIKGIESLLERIPAGDSFDLPEGSDLILQSEAVLIPSAPSVSSLDASPDASPQC